MSVNQSILIPEYTSGVHPVIAQSNISMYVDILGNTDNMDYYRRSISTVSLYDRSGESVDLTTQNPNTDKPTVYTSTTVRYPNIASSYSYPGASACNFVSVTIYEDTQPTGCRLWFEEDTGADLYTYVTNDCSLWSRFYGGLTNSYCVAGIIKRNAIVPGLSVSDVVLGVLVDNGIGSFIVDGVVIYTYSHGVGGYNMNDIGIYFNNTSTLNTSRDWNKGTCTAWDVSGPAIYNTYEYDALNVDLIFYIENCAGGFQVSVGSAFAVSAVPAVRWQNFVRTEEINA